MSPVRARAPAALAPWRRHGRELWVALLDVLCPPHCPSCGVPAAQLCAPCRTLLEPRPAPLCPRCGVPLPAADAPCATDHRHVRGLSWVRAPLRYRGTGGRLVRRVKFAGDRAAARELTRRMADAARAWAVGEGRRAVVGSVPLHRSKRRRRGHDQAAWLAEGVALRLGLRFRARLLRRSRDTLPQGDPRVLSRAQNVHGAFAVRRPRVVAGAAVLLIDDVATSWHTARECARVLRAAGARRVALLCAAQGGEHA